MKRRIANILATIVALAVGLLTMYVTKLYLKDPDGAMDWAVLVLSGVTTGIIAFFMTWGHFQGEPGAEGQ